MKDLLGEIKEKVFSKYKKDCWEIKSIAEISKKVYIGNEISKEQLGTGDYPAIKCGDITSGKLNLSFDKCISFVDINLIKTKKFFKYGDLLVSNFSDAKKVGRASVYLGKEECLAGKGVTVVKHNQNPKYLSYVWSTDYVREQIVKSSLQGTVFNFWSEKVKEIKIPLPPLEIQNEIVEFLDKFTELEKELEMRKEQYEYYKELIFNKEINEGNWEIKKLKDISMNMFNGTEVTREQLGRGNYPAIKCGDINSQLPLYFEECISFVDEKEIKRPKYFEYGDFIVSNFSNSNKTVASGCSYLGKEKCLAGLGVTVIKHNQNPKYLSYIWTSKFVREQIIKDSLPGTVFNFWSEKIKQIQIPVPSLEEQNKVVEKLDLLYKMTNDIKEGIPLLIQKNKEQYNFYKEIVLEK